MQDNLKNEIIDTEKIIINFPKSLSKISFDMIKQYEDKIEQIYSIFGINDFRKVQANMFDDKQEFRDYIIDIRNGDAASLPEWAGGTYDKGMVNKYISKKELDDINLYKHRKCTIPHELTHIIYWEKVLGDNFNNRVIWLDEGLATNLSAENDELNDQNKFVEFINSKILNKKCLSNMNELDWNNFRTEDYNGYDLCYFCMKYMLEIYSTVELQQIIYNHELSIEIGNDILDKAIEYYSNKYNLKKASLK